MWNTIFYEPIVNLLLFVYKLVGENLGLAILGITLFLRLVLWPLTTMQLKSQKKMQDMQPNMKKLQEKDRSELTMAEVGAVKDMSKGCVLGCLPTLIQLPFLISLYKALRILATTTAGNVFNDIAYSDFLRFGESYVFNTKFLGLNLATIPSEIGLKSTAVIPYLALAGLVGVSQWATTKLMASTRKKDTKKSKEQKAKEKEKAKKKDKKKGKDGKKKSDKDLQQEMMDSTNSYMQVMFPLMIAFASFSVPAALSIYWFAQSVFLLGQVGVGKLNEQKAKESKSKSTKSSKSRKKSSEAKAKTSAKQKKKKGTKKSAGKKK